MAESERFMQRNRLRLALAECDRFVRFAKDYQRELEKNPAAPYLHSPSKHRAATQRASMDLSNALAVFRRGPRKGGE